METAAPLHPAETAEARCRERNGLFLANRACLRSRRLIYKPASGGGEQKTIREFRGNPTRGAASNPNWSI